MDDDCGNPLMELVVVLLLALLHLCSVVDSPFEDKHIGVMVMISALPSTQQIIWSDGSRTASLTGVTLVWMPLYRRRKMTGINGNKWNTCNTTKARSLIVMILLEERLC